MCSGREEERGGPVVCVGLVEANDTGDAQATQRLDIGGGRERNFSFVLIHTSVHNWPLESDELGTNLVDIAVQRIVELFVQGQVKRAARIPSDRSGFFKSPKAVFKEQIIRVQMRSIMKWLKGEGDKRILEWSCGLLWRPPVIQNHECGKKKTGICSAFQAAFKAINKLSLLFEKPFRKCITKPMHNTKIHRPKISCKRHILSM